jgi:hypothetical protein
MLIIFFQVSEVGTEINVVLAKIKEYDILGQSFRKKECSDYS